LLGLATKAGCYFLKKRKGFYFSLFEVEALAKSVPAIFYSRRGTHQLLVEADNVNTRVYWEEAYIL